VHIHHDEGLPIAGSSLFHFNPAPKRSRRNDLKPCQALIMLKP
jgi:hypothetical protein